MARGGRIAVVGTGLIGASVGLAWAAAGGRALGWDPDANAMQTALTKGAITEAIPDLDAMLESLEAGDILVLAAPVQATLDLLARPALRSTRAGLILDTASVKGAVARAGRGMAAFVPSHPIAGSERSGPEFARADLFAGKVWTLDDTAAAGPLAAAGAFVEALGARPIQVSAARHDAVLAFTSHLPQLLAISLAEELGARLDDPLVRALCGPGIQSMVRLGASSWTMWQGIVAENYALISQELRNFAAILGEVADEIEASDGARIEGRFARAARAVAAFGRDGTGGLPVEDSAKATLITLED